MAKPTNGIYAHWFAGSYRDYFKLNYMLGKYIKKLDKPVYVGRMSNGYRLQW